MPTFGAMGTEIAVYAPGLASADEERLAAGVAAIFARSEARFSRFRSESELSQLNAADRPTVVSRELFDVLQSARRYFELTDGIFDPTVAAALAGHGYDRSFTVGALDRLRIARAPACSFGDVMLDEATSTVDKPLHVRVDLGGIVKGRTADQAAELLPRPGAVDAGGDAVLRDVEREGARWIVDVEDPRDARRTLLALAIGDRAVATSGTNRRRWAAGGGMAHHLIDPRTGEPTASDLAQVTIVAPSAELAEVVAKTVLVLGARDGGSFLSRFDDVAGILVGTNGNVRRIGDLEVIDG